MASYWTTYSWSTTSTTSNTSNTYYVDPSKLYGIWNINTIKKDKIDECKIEDDEVLDLLKDDD